MCMPACCARAAVDKAELGMISDSKRKCRDVLCCVFFALFWVGMIVIAGVAFKTGNPTRLLYGTDYNGEVCGQNSLRAKKYITYPRVAEDAIINAGKTPFNMKFYGICVKTCPLQYDVVCDYNPTIQTDITTNPAYTQAALLQCVNGTSPAPTGVDCALVLAHCWVTPVDTIDTLFHCLPVQQYSQDVNSTCIFPSYVTSSNSPECIIARQDLNGVLVEPAHQNILFKSLSTTTATWARYFGDLQRTWYVIIICGVLVAMVISLLWLFLIKWMTTLMVALAIILTVFICIALTLFCYFKGGILNPAVITPFTSEIHSPYSTKLQNSLTASADNQGRFKVAAYVFTGITIIVMCLAVALRKSIFTAVNVIKLGVRAVNGVPCALFYPIFTVVLLTSLLVWWVFVAASMVSAGKITLSQFTGFNSTLYPGLPSLNSTFKSVENNNVMQYLLIYHFFGLLWTNQFIQGLGMCTIAGGCAGWYFAQNDEKNPSVDIYPQPRFAILKSFWRTVRYSLGSVAFGALLIAIIQAIRAALAYFQRTSKRLQNSSRLVKAILCCVQCCLKVFQTLVEVVTRNAYIYIALKGHSFCQAGREVFSMMANNVIVLAVVNMLSEMIAFMGKIFVSSVAGFAAFWYIERTAKFQPGGSEQVSSSWFPVILSMLFAYCVSSGFFYVFDMAVDTMLVCFIVDCEENQARNGGGPAHKVPVHFKRDLIAKLDANAETAKETSIANPAVAGPSAAAPGYGST